jgi:hypothetical protein
MKKAIFLVTLALCIIGTSTFADQKQVQPKKSSATPLRISVWPGAWYYPKGWPVYGLNLGLPATSGTNEKVNGADLAILFAETNNVRGCQSAIVNLGDDLIGAQIGIVSLSNNIKGGQAAIYSSADKLDGFQLGIVNKTEEADGFQIGLVNIMDNGFLKVFPFFNYSVSKDKK